MSVLRSGVCIVLLLLALSLSAQQTMRVSAAQFYIFDQQSVSVSGGELTELRINFSIPIDSTVIQSPPSSTLKTDAQGNPYLEVYLPRPDLPFSYAINTTIDTRARSVQELPSQWEAPSGMAAYLSSSDQVPASDPAFVRLAQQITANATTPFEQLSALAQWTNNYITYDPSMVGQNLPAREILKVRRGVCTEYATLFTTLARSLGYPTRFVNGYAYSDKYNAWLGHAWAEVYIGQWVSVNPTWLEVGALDATHIVSSRQAVQDFKSASVTAMVSPASAKLVWDGGQSRGAVADNVHLVSETADAPDENFALLASSGRLPPGGKFIVVMQYPARDYRLLSSTLAPCRNDNGPPIITMSGPAEVRLTTEPNQSAYAVWVGQSSPSLDSNVRYACPVTLNSEYLALRSLALNITTADAVDWPSLDAQLSSTAPEIGTNLSVFARLPPSMAGHPITLVENQLMMTGTVPRDGRATFTLPASRRGPHTLYLFSDAGDPVALDYDVGASSGLTITDIRPARPMVEGSPNQLLVDWTNLAANTSGWHLAWSWGGQSGYVDMVSGTRSTVLPFTPSSSGNALLTVRLLGPDGHEMLRQSQPLDVLPAVNVTVDSLQLAPSPTAGLWQASIHVSSSSPVNGLTLRLDGRVRPVPDDGTVSIELNPGLYNASLSWTDAAGTAREKIFQINASAVPPSPSSSINPSMSNLPLNNLNICLLPIVLLFIFALAAMVWFFRHRSGSSQGFG